MRFLPLLALVALALAGCGGSGSSGGGGLELEVSEKPLRLAVVRGGETVVEQDAGARFRYQLASTGEQFSLTDVTARHGNVYEVGTTEPGRTATVTVTRRPSGFRVGVRIRPERDVLYVIDALRAGADDHFLGAGERGS